MKKISKRIFVYCSLQDQEIPLENGESCCEFFNDENKLCEYSKYSHHSKIGRISEREELYAAFSQRDDEEEN